MMVPSGAFADAFNLGIIIKICKVIFTEPPYNKAACLYSDFACVNFDFHYGFYPFVLMLTARSFRAGKIAIKSGETGKVIAARTSSLGREDYFPFCRRVWRRRPETLCVRTGAFLLVKRVFTGKNIRFFILISLLF